MEWSAASPATVVIGICVLLLVWYFIGSQWNRRRLRLFVRGLAKAFQGQAPPPKIQWLGSSAFQVLADNPPGPFRRLGIMVVLEPREMLVVWIVNWFRGRHDLLVIKGELQREPRWELELFDLATPTGREARRSAEAERWVVADAGLPAPLRWAYPAHQADPRPRWTGILEGLPFRLHRLSLRRSSPHLLMSLSPPPGELPGEVLLKTVVEVGERALGH